MERPLTRRALLALTVLLVPQWAFAGASSQPSSAPTSRPKVVPNKGRAPDAKRALSQDPYAGLDHTGTPLLPPRKLVMPKASGSGMQPRPLPNYDGRSAAEATAENTLVWIPRVLFLPGYLLLEYGVRWPLVALTTKVEEHHLIERTQRIFTFANGKAGLYPTILLDFGLNPSAGLFFYYDDLFVKKNRLVLQAGFWVNEWVHLVATDSFKIFSNDEGQMTLSAEFSNRPDRVFTGINQVSRNGVETFFRQRDFELEARLRTYLRGLNRVTVAVGYRNVWTGDGEDFGELSIADANSPFVRDASLQVDQSLAPGYGDNYSLLKAQLKFELDSRTPERLFTAGSGLRLELFGSFAANPADAELRFFRFGGEAAAFWDITGRNHVLALRLYLEGIENIGDHLVPFTERLILGGPEYLRGFNEGFLRGDSASVLTLDYRYPIWVLFDANIFFSVGNVFAGFFETFHPKRLVATWGAGIRTNTSRDVSFDLLVAFGSKQFQLWDDSEVLDNVRVIVGINQGF